MILLSQAIDIGRDHLIPRKRAPFPYEGKALTQLKLGLDFECRARRAIAHLIHREAVPLPLRGEGLSAR